MRQCECADIDAIEVPRGIVVGKNQCCSVCCVFLISRCEINAESLKQERGSETRTDFPIRLMRTDGQAIEFELLLLKKYMIQLLCCVCEIFCLSHGFVNK